MQQHGEGLVGIAGSIAAEVRAPGWPLPTAATAQLSSLTPPGGGPGRSGPGLQLARQRTALESHPATWATKPRNHTHAQDRKDEEIPGPYPHTGLSCVI